MGVGGRGLRLDVNKCLNEHPGDDLAILDIRGQGHLQGVQIEAPG